MTARLRALLLVPVAASLLTVRGGAATEAASPGPGATDDAVIVHVLNRIGFGPRPGDVERVRRMGLDEYLRMQLHPERLPDRALDERLRPLATLTMSARELAERYERPLLQAKRERKQGAVTKPGTEPPPDALQRLPPDDPRRQGAVPLLELQEQKILRAIYSERQLEAVLTDFWFNHFNVDARKGPGRFALTEYERDVIRPHVLGRFRDLLEATAKSPAMLFYLDNWMSADPKSAEMSRDKMTMRGGLARRGAARFRTRGGTTPEQRERLEQRMPRGLNENYGRELLELHTLGVDGGYTQQDVTEVARAFTGWSIDGPRRGGGFVFRSPLHDRAEKTVLGHHLAADGGERDGEQVLDILASHPSTARHVSAKLARRFVSDTPSDSLVDRLATTFTRTNGDLRAVMTALLTSPEFLAPDASRAKVKTPFDFAVSALRSTGAEVTTARAIARSLQEMGMPLYQCQPPTGYQDTADAWVNTGALVNRMNAALAIANGAMPGVTVNHPPEPGAVLPAAVSDATRGTIAKASTAPQALALALGSPEFQKR